MLEIKSSSFISAMFSLDLAASAPKNYVKKRTDLKQALWCVEELRSELASSSGTGEGLGSR